MEFLLDENVEEILALEEHLAWSWLALVLVARGDMEDAQEEAARTYRSGN